MRDYVKGMLEEFPIQFAPDETMPTPASDNLLSPSTGELLDQNAQRRVPHICRKRLVPVQEGKARHPPSDRYIMQPGEVSHGLRLGEVGASHEVPEWYT